MLHIACLSGYHSGLSMFSGICSWWYFCLERLRSNAVDSRCRAAYMLILHSHMNSSSVVRCRAETCLKVLIFSHSLSNVGSSVRGLKTFSVVDSYWIWPLDFYPNTTQAFVSNENTSRTMKNRGLHRHSLVLKSTMSSEMFLCFASPLSVSAESNKSTSFWRFEHKMLCFLVPTFQSLRGHLWRFLHLHCHCGAGLYN